MLTKSMSFGNAITAITAQLHDHSMIVKKRLIFCSDRDGKDRF